VESRSIDSRDMKKHKSRVCEIGASRENVVQNKEQSRTAIGREN